MEKIESNKKLSADNIDRIININHEFVNLDKLSIYFSPQKTPWDRLIQYEKEKWNTNSAFLNECSLLF